MQGIRTDVTLIRHAWSGIRVLFTGSTPGACTYVEHNALGILGLLLAVGFIPDIIFRHLALPQSLDALNWSIDALELLSAAWILGLYGTMTLRPHVLDGPRARFRLGALADVAIERRSIERAEIVGSSKRTDRRRLRRSHRDAFFFAAPGSSWVRVDLRQEIVVKSYPLFRSRRVRCLFVASDRPADLAALLTRGE